ncbi:MAG: aminotransferase class III-fold pyridoxal phosphate-dependent enzyme [Candidatus Nanopelagicales bacterium]
MPDDQHHEATPGDPDGQLTKAQVLELAEKYVCPDRVRFLQGAGIDLVVGRREGYRLWDMGGRELLDLHLNGGVYNLGHRHPRIVAALIEGVATYDIGNHHFPSSQRALLARDLVTATPGMRYAVFAAGGGEAIDLAIKSARRATGRTRIVSAHDAYHGHTGLALAVGDQGAAHSFLSESADVTRVPFNDPDAVEAALAAGDVAAVILETVPATAGFVPPLPGYLTAVRDACTRTGTLFIADEVQTGLGRSGSLWAISAQDVVPDALVTGKGLSGGVYPIAATLLGERAGGWLEEDGWGHISTFGGAELGCVVAREVLSLTQQLLPAVPGLAERWGQGLADLRERHSGWLTGVRQTGLIIGLEFAHEVGGMLMTRMLYDEGVWAMFAGFDRRVLQLKPGLLLDGEDIDRVLAALDRACTTAAAL